MDFNETVPQLMDDLKALTERLAKLERAVADRLEGQEIEAAIAEQFPSTVPGKKAK